MSEFEHGTVSINKHSALKSEASDDWAYRSSSKIFLVDILEIDKWIIWNVAISKIHIKKKM